MPEQTEPRYSLQFPCEMISIPSDQFLRLEPYGLIHRSLIPKLRVKRLYTFKELETTNTPTPKSRLAVLSTTWLKKLRDKLYFRRK